MTKIGVQRVHIVRGRGGNLKFRALRLDTGNFTWGSEGNIDSSITCVEDMMIC
jgi:small subunit ribosomal protein S8e